MKKFISIVMCFALVCGVVGLAVACGIQDEFSDFEKAFGASLEVINDGSKEVESGAESIVLSNPLLGAETEITEENEVVEPSLSEKLTLALTCYDNIKESQIIIDEETIAIKELFTTLKQNYKQMKEKGLSLTEEQKTIVIQKTVEAIEARKAIEGTIGKVYQALREAKGIYKLATIDQALVVLSDANTNMQIRTENVLKLKQLLLEVSEIVSEKMAESTAE